MENEFPQRLKPVRLDGFTARLKARPFKRNVDGPRGSGRSIPALRPAIHDALVTFHAVCDLIC
jgi:hypothetical protein